MKLKVYHDHDGTYRYMVAATSYAAAAKLLDTTVGSLKNYGGTFPRDSGAAQIALVVPGKVFWSDMRKLGNIVWESFPEETNP